MSDSKLISGKQRFFAKAILAARSSYWQDARSSFVLSTGRTGTETLARLLDLSAEISAFHEPRPQLMAERMTAFREVRTQPTRYAEIFSKARSVPLAASKLSGKMYAETSARLTFFAPVISDLLKNAKFVYLYRHPGSVVRSGMRRGWYDGHPADRYRITPPEDSDAARHWANWSRFSKICWYWAAYNEFALEFIEHLNPSRVLAIRSEELFDADTGKWSDIFDFLEVQAPNRVEVEQTLGARHNEQVKGDFPRYEQWSSEQHEILERVAGLTMAKLGLESNGEPPEHSTSDPRTGAFREF